MEEKERKEKSDKLFDKGMECYNKQQYKEALKYFEACIKFYKNDRAELFIGVCKNNIPENDSSNTKNNRNYTQSNTNSNNNSYHKAYSYSGMPSSSSTSTSSNNTYHKSASSSTDDASTNKEDKICKELLKKKDYYDILNISKNATPEEIKKGYKKQAIRFHPDKNRSKLSEECFKKISEAYQCLSNEEKKNFYDKYGNEEEFKQKYYEANQRYYQEEMDPFEAFNMFFGNGFPHRGYNFYWSNDNQNGGDIRNRRGVSLLGYIPILFFFLIYLLPDFSSILFESKPLYQFSRNSYYSHKRRTSINGVEFYVGENFIKKYPKMKDFKFMEPQIEKEYLGLLYEDCSNTINYKNQLQYFMNRAYTMTQKNVYKKKMDQLNFSSCHKYNSLVNLIR